MPRAIMKTQLALHSSLILAALLAFAGVAHAQQVSLQEETFSLPINDAFALLRKFPTDAERYSELVRRVDAKQARLERLIVVRTISGQQAKAESMHELICPKEHEPPRAAGTNATAARRRAESMLARNVFQTRNLGDILNFTPQVGASSLFINITLIPESSFFVGYKGAGDQKWARQPMIETKRLTTSVMVKSGEPFLLGTLSPPFNDGIAPSSREHRIWLDFITAHAMPVGK